MASCRLDSIFQLDPVSSLVSTVHVCVDIHSSETWSERDPLLHSASKMDDDLVADAMNEQQARQIKQQLEERFLTPSKTLRPHWLADWQLFVLEIGLCCRGAG